MKLRSSAFDDFKALPSEFTADGSNHNPPLTVSEVPEGTKSLALIVHDPDATGGGDWLHWIVWNIDPKTTEITPGDSLVGAVQGVTDFGQAVYGGPAPHPGSGVHRYVFELYAVDQVLKLPQDPSREDVEMALAGHTLAQSTWTGTYERTK